MQKTPGSDPYLTERPPPGVPKYSDSFYRKLKGMFSALDIKWHRRACRWCVTETDRHGRESVVLVIATPTGGFALPDNRTCDALWGMDTQRHGGQDKYQKWVDDETAKAKQRIADEGNDEVREKVKYYADGLRGKVGVAPNPETAGVSK